MKITRYFQSCLLVEDNGVRILIDPSGQEKERLGDFGRLDAVLYTHEHPDHFDAQMACDFVEQGIAPVYANAGTARNINASKTVVEDGNEYEINGLKIKARDLPHCLMVDGSQGPQNTGYLLNSKLFHPGDGYSLEGLNVPILAAPINGPDISLHVAYKFTMQLNAKQIIPIHYDFLGGNPNFLADSLNKHGVKVHALTIGHSIKL